MTESNKLPAEFQAIADAVDAESPQLREMFHYALALVMIDDEQARIIGMRMDGEKEYITLEIIGGERFEIVRPSISSELQAELRARVQKIMDEDE